MTKQELEQQNKQFKDFLNHSYRVPVEINEDIYLLNTKTKIVTCHVVLGYKIGDGFGVMEISGGHELQYWYEGGEDHLGAYEPIEKKIEEVSGDYEVFFTVEELINATKNNPEIGFYGRPGYGTWEELLEVPMYPREMKNIFEKYSVYYYDIKE